MTDETKMSVSLLLLLVWTANLLVIAVMILMLAILVALAPNARPRRSAGWVATETIAARRF